MYQVVPPIRCRKESREQPSAFVAELGESGKLFQASFEECDLALQGLRNSLAIEKGFAARIVGADIHPVVELLFRKGPVDHDEANHLAQIGEIADVFVPRIIVHGF